MVKIRQRLPDDIRQGKRLPKNGNRQVVNFQLPVFAAVPGQEAGSGCAGIMSPVAFTGGGLLMAGTGEDEDFFMARAYGNHTRPADDDQQKGKQHDAVAQCSNHDMPKILERRHESVKSKMENAKPPA